MSELIDGECQGGQMHVEHQAWLRMCEHLYKLGIEVNANTVTPLVLAIRLWGEELHQLRLGAPQYDEAALLEARHNCVGD